MGLTIGSLHILGTLTKEQQAANPYRRERDGRVSVYAPDWDNPLILYADAEMLSRETGIDVLAFYCFDEDAVGLTLYRSGNAVAGGVSSLDEGLSQTPQNMAQITAAFGVEDADGAILEQLMTDAPLDTMQQIEELAAYLRLPLLPDAKLVEQMEADKRERKHKRKQPTASQRLDAYAQGTFGERMAALGFTTFKYHRWYKLIRDEVLLSFGLIPQRYGLFHMMIEVMPTCERRMCFPPDTSWGYWPYVLCADNMLTEMRHWNHGSDSIQRGRVCFVIVNGFIDPLEKQAMETIFDKAVEPTLRRITNVREAMIEMQWWMFVLFRQYDYFSQYGYYQQASEGEERLPTVENYELRGTVYRVFNQFCFFRMYEDLWHMALRNGCKDIAFPCPPPGVRGWDDYEGMERVLEEQKYEGEEYLLLKNRDEAAIEERLHRTYEENLKLIKRRLKLTPDCSDTIWDRDYRHPYDIKQMLQERYERCAPRMHEGDYTIDFI